MTASARIGDCGAQDQRQPRLDAGGTAWRLRSLLAMGHNCARMARALNVRPDVVRRVVSGQTRSVTPEFRARAWQLWNAWWDKTPPQRTAAERCAAAQAVRQAAYHNWPAAAGLDEDLLDEPGYRPWSRYRPATGTGEATDFVPAPAGPTPHGRSHEHARGGAAHDPRPPARPVGERRPAKEVSHMNDDEEIHYPWPAVSPVAPPPGRKPDTVGTRYLRRLIAGLGEAPPRALGDRADPDREAGG